MKESIEKKDSINEIHLKLGKEGNEKNEDSLYRESETKIIEKFDNEEFNILDETKKLLEKKKII